MSFPIARVSRGAFLLAVISLIALAVAYPAFAQTESVLYSFGASSTDGKAPRGPLVMDKKGNLYGVTWYGGTNGYGTVFELSPSGTSWTETVLYNFGAAPDAQNPQTGLIIDSKGNLYGTSPFGGAHKNNQGQPDPLGAVFELTPTTKNGVTTWKESILYSFGTNSGDGMYPFGSLLMDKQGNLYGTTQSDPVHFSGTIYKLTPTTVKKVTTWSETILHQFTDYENPLGGLIADKAGDLYGTGSDGGANFAGELFELTPGGTLNVIYTFGSTFGTGAYPQTGLVMDSKGNLYGTTQFGGPYVGSGYGNNSGGTVYQLTPKGTLNYIYGFGGYTADGQAPLDSLVIDAKGDLYGTTWLGGTGPCTTTNAPSGCGTVFELKPTTKKGKTTWTESILYNFDGPPTDGSFPVDGLTFVKATGNFYGVTPTGGANNYGTMFELIP
jgi:uncharacterized repeat protein (TIGR03803 family)